MDEVVAAYLDAFSRLCDVMAALGFIFSQYGDAGVQYVACNGHGCTGKWEP